MLGFHKNRASQPEQLSWPAILALLENERDWAALHHVYPGTRSESFLAALRRIDPSLATELIATGNRLESADALMKCPVVAVAGMLNSGKTSLVASFLSPAGRARTLRGVSNAQGTHRFVLWLPNSWKQDPELWNQMLQRLAEALGHPPEALGESPEAAHDQYNNRQLNPEQAAVALVATDPSLDQLGIALLDCPDIVSDAALGLGTPQQRRQLLARAATLCSAFLIVASAEQSRDSTLGDLMRLASELMPGVPRILAVNKIRAKQQSAQEVIDTFRPLMQQSQIEKVYAAYDFDVRGSEALIPSKQHNAIAQPITRRDELPIFFQLNLESKGKAKSPASSPTSGHPPPMVADSTAEIAPARLLAALPSQLDRSAMFQSFRLALEANLRTMVWDRAFQQIQTFVRQQDQHCVIARRCLLDAGLEMFAIRGESGQFERLRLHQSRRILDQLTTAFAATAPWYARWSVHLNSRYRQLVGGAGDRVRRWLPSRQLDHQVNQIKGQFQRGDLGSVMTADRLQSLLKQRAEVYPLAHWDDDAPWTNACRTAIHRYDRDDFTALDPYELDAACQEMWSKVTWYEKGKFTALPLLVMISTLTAAMVAVVDGGATLTVTAVSISELLAAGGFTAAAAVWAGGKTASLVEQQAAKQQLVDFVAVLCDTFGVARAAEQPPLILSKTESQLPAAKIIQREPVGPTLASTQVNRDFATELARLLHLPPPQ